MLVELSVVEQRYRALLRVLVSGVPVTEVADRSGVSRKSVQAWVRRYEQLGVGRVGGSLAPAASSAACVGRASVSRATTSPGQPQLTVPGGGAALTSWRL